MKNTGIVKNVMERDGMKKRVINAKNAINTIDYYLKYFKIKLNGFKFIWNK